MRLTLKNQIGSPYDIQTMNGPVILPAFGELTADFSDADAEMYRAAGIVADEPEPEKPKKKAKRQDDDED